MLLLLTGIYVYEIYLDVRIPVPYTERVMGIPVVDNLDFLTGKESRCAQINPGVLFQQIQLPYAADGTLYLAQDPAVTEWVGEFSTTSRNTFLCMLPDAAWQDKAACIRENHAFELYLVEDKVYYPLRLVICGMPVISITTDREEEQDLGDYETDPDRYYFDPEILYFGHIQIFDPINRAAGGTRYQILEAGVRYYPRGASSARFDKKSYGISLLDARGANLDEALLGMRSDNSWKLNAMVVDTSRLREKTASQIWEQFSQSNEEVNETGPRIEYAELLLDGAYAGLYELVEPVDAKKLKLDKNDVLYKITAWDTPDDEDIQYAIDHKWRIMSFHRIRYPEPVTDYEKAWYPLRDYLNTFYRADREAQGADRKVYLSNAVDMLLFNMAVSGSDNWYKNLYFAADVDESGTYRMRQIPWDLDLTFGEMNEGIFNPDETVIYEEAAVPFLIRQDPEKVRPYLQTRWREARETFLSNDSLYELIHRNQDTLIQAGAITREQERWPQYGMTTDISDMEELLWRRMEWLDEYFEAY